MSAFLFLVGPGGSFYLAVRVYRSRVPRINHSRQQFVSAAIAAVIIIGEWPENMAVTCRRRAQKFVCKLGLVVPGRVIRLSALVVY